MSILVKHVYESDRAWTPEAQARYASILEKYPYISPETQYSTTLPTPPGLSPREACQSAAEEALFAGYRPLRAGFVQDYVDAGENAEGVIGVDMGDGDMQFSVNRDQLFELLKSVVGKEVRTQKNGDDIWEMTSTRRKRHIKMKNHKRRKLYRYLMWRVLMYRRRRMRTEKQKLGKI
jgi:hypothetical protein